MALLVIIPQILVALTAQWAGRLAQSRGRRPLLLFGFGASPVRALLFGLIIEPVLLGIVQVLDGISGIVLGVLQPLIIADLAGRGGRFNLAQGFVGMISGIGASLSTALSGLIVVHLGLEAGFIAVSMIGMIAFGIVWVFMPETKIADGRT